MEVKAVRYYFSAVKFLTMAAITVYIIVNRRIDYLKLSSLICLLAIFLLISTLYEYSLKNRWIWLAADCVLLICLGALFTMDCFYLLPFLLLDLAVLLDLKWPAYFLPLLGCIYPWDNRFFYFFCALFEGIIYVQHYIFFRQYQKRLEAFEQEEYALKDVIDSEKLKLKKELRENGLYYENRMLEEKTVLSQALHDKLGHSINGSIYQLEACKVLLDKDKEKCNSMIQNVVDSLRVSMDEIRGILRREKPDKKQSSMLQLYALSEECRKKYNIQMDLLVHGDIRTISDDLWEAILDNTFEAVTNALKYADCSEITIELYSMNKLVRCSISDNGKGCLDFKTGMGIEGMKQRARRLNGTIAVETLDGFRVNMIFPKEG